MAKHHSSFFCLLQSWEMMVPAPLQGLGNLCSHDASYVLRTREAGDLLLLSNPFGVPKEPATWKPSQPFSPSVPRWSASLSDPSLLIDGSPLSSASKKTSSLLLNVVLSPNPACNRPGSCPKAMTKTILFTFISELQFSPLSPPLNLITKKPDKDLIYLIVLANCTSSSSGVLQ